MVSHCVVPLLHYTFILLRRENLQASETFSESHPSCNEAALPRGQSQFSVQRASPEFSISRLHSAPASQWSRVTKYRNDNQSRPSTSSLNLLSLNYATITQISYDHLLKATETVDNFERSNTRAPSRPEISYERTHAYLSTCHVLIYPSKAA